MTSRPRRERSPTRGEEAIDPFARSFVVRFDATTDAKRERFAGRVEHLRSGRRAFFATRKAFAEFVRSILREEERRGTSANDREEEKTK